MKTEVFPVPDYRLYTEAFIEKASTSETMKAISQEGGISEDEALTWAVSVMANGHIRAAVTLGQEAQGLSVWHQVVAGMCSDLYSDLQQKSPGLSREAINNDEELLKLNAVRRGIRVAMRASYRCAQYKTELRRGLSS